MLKSFVQLWQVDLAYYAILILVQGRLVADHADSRDDAAFFHVVRHDSLVELFAKLA